MRGTNKIIFNTIVLYVNIIVCMVVSLWTVPLVLSSLGEDDYGLYSLIGGVVAMLSFLNGAMTISTQRFLSVTLGEGNRQRLSEVFSQSILLHLAIGLLILAIVEVCAPLLLDHVLTMNPGRVGTARLLFHYLVLSMFFSILAVPLDAVLNAYENMLVFSLFTLLEYLLRLGVALSLPFVTSDRLNYYGFAVLGAGMLVFLLKFFFVRLHYRHLRFSLSTCRNRKLFWQLASFAGWNTLSTVAVLGRNQGLAVVLNSFFGTAVNAAYGVGTRVNGVLGYFSSTIQKSINPQLMASQGAHDRDSFMRLTFSLTKYSVLSMSIVALPLFVEMPYVMELWLPKELHGVVEFARLIILLNLIFQLSSGLMSAVQSTGRVRSYTVSVALVLLSVLPLACLLLKSGLPPTSALLLACVTEGVALFVRLAFAHRLAGVPSGTYLVRLVLPLVLLFLGVGGVLWFLSQLLQPSFGRLVLVCLTDVVLYGGVAFFFILEADERDKVKSLWQVFLQKIQFRKSERI